MVVMETDPYFPGLKVQEIRDNNFPSSLSLIYLVGVFFFLKSNFLTYLEHIMHTFVFSYSLLDQKKLPHGFLEEFK